MALHPGRLTVAAGLLAALLAGPSPAAHAQPTTSTTSSTDAVRQAEGRAGAADADATAAEARLEQLTSAYSQAQGRLTVALGGLATSFSAGVRADRELDAQRRALGQARADRIRVVRAIYTSGGRLAVLASVLDAGNGEDALYRATASQRVLRDLTAAGDRRVRQLSVTVAAGAAAVAASKTADDDRLAVLSQANQAAGQAEQTLAEAQQTLQQLRSQAQHLSDQAEAARLLAEADELARKLAAAQTIAATGQAGAVAQVSAMTIPDGYRHLYQAAAQTCPTLRWTLLAAVGQVESGHGRNNGPSSAGAIGPMQFMPATFARFAVDGDGDGVTDPWNPADAIYTAARYLCVSGIDGSPDGVQRALFAYNNAQWYVDLVLATEQKIIQAGA